jgi:DNA-binding transcriptional LysR family regulator
LPVLPRFLSENREISLSLHLTDETIDFGSDDIDVAIRFSEQLDDQNVIVRKLARNRRVLVAAPGYLQGNSAPRRLADLARHTCLTMTTAPDWNNWVPAETEAARQVFQASSADAVYHAALAGIGIARLSTYLVNADIEAGRLVRVLPDYTQQESAIVAAYRDRRNVSPRIRAFIDFLAGWFGPVPPWERT